MFLATPHSGSGIAGYVGAMGRVARSSEAIRELRRNAALLRDLNLWFRTAYLQKPWKLRIYFETLATAGVRVVDEGSADPGIAGITPTAVDANHSGICKPELPDFRVKQTIQLIADVATGQQERRDRPSIQTLLMAPDDQIPLLRARLESEVAANPKDRKMREALAFAASMQVRRMASTSFQMNPMAPHARYAMAPRSSGVGCLAPLLIGAAILAFQYFGAGKWLAAAWHGLLSLLP